MYRQISDYALIGDTRTAALVSSEGSIDWLCWPRFDSPAMFLAILDDERGGFCDLQIQGGDAVGRAYESDTNILATRFEAGSGRGTLIDFMPMQPARSDDAPFASVLPSSLVRMLRCDAGTLTGTFRIKPTFDYARASARVLETHDGARFVSGEGTLTLLAGRPAARVGDAAEVRFVIAAGESAFIVLSSDGGTGTHLIESGSAEALLVETRTFWHDWIGRCTYEGDYAPLVRRSALCLKLMTYSPTGAMVAAPTTSLPEAVPGNRNFDYRFAWLRDATFTMLAFLNLGFLEEAADFLRFLRDADKSRGRDLRVMYGIHGEIEAEIVLDHLKGWRGTRPVRIGNLATMQRQHDIYGEFLMSLHAYLSAVDFAPPDPIREALPELISNLAEQAVARRHEPDNGIWELRSGCLQLLHTKALLWVALDRAVKMARRIDGIAPHSIDLWEKARDEIRAEYTERAWNESRGAFVQSYGSDVLDSSVLRVVLFGAIDPRNPKLASTLAAIEKDLADRDLIRRYHAPDGFDGEEGAFLACSFWRVGCLALMGRTISAKALFETLLSRANDVGLFAEEMDTETGESRGNFPQGFTHMAVINHAIRLQECIARFGLKGDGDITRPHQGPASISAESDMPLPMR